MTRLSTGELERRILEALGSGDAGMTPREVHEIIGAERELAYTTVMTILVRLWQKGLATRERDGRAFRYSPSTSVDALTADRMRQLLGTAANSDAALTHFVRNLGTKDRAQLRKLLGRGQP